MTDLNKNLMGVSLIIFGIIFSENSIEMHSNYQAILSMIFFISGWYIFFSTQSYNLIKIGIWIPIIAMIGQIYFGYILGINFTQRRKYIMMTMIFWIIFMLIWFYYAYKLSYNSYERFKYIIIGLLLLIGGMMGYFFIRNNNWYQLTGGIIPNIKLNFGLFNPFIPMVAIGWMLIGIGNSIN